MHSIITRVNHRIVQSLKAVLSIKSALLFCELVSCFPWFLSSEYKASHFFLHLHNINLYSHIFLYSEIQNKKCNPHCIIQNTDIFWILQFGMQFLYSRLYFLKCKTYTLDCTIRNTEIYGSAVRSLGRCKKKLPTKQCHKF